MDKVAIYPGSFDPITLGHMDIIDRSLNIFNKVVIGVLYNSKKKYLFSGKERMKFIEQIYSNSPYRDRIIIEIFDGLLVDFVKKHSSKIIIRGLRAISDFDYELQLALTNRNLNSEIDTIFLMPNIKYIYLSSRLVKEISSLDGNVSEMVHPIVEDALNTSKNL